MANLAEIATGQMQAVSNRRWPKRLPLEEVIHAELPAKKAEGRVLEDRRLFEKELAQDKELFQKDLAQREEQSLAELAAAEEQAGKAEGIQAIGMGIQGGKLASEWVKDAGEGAGEFSEWISPVATGFGVGYGIKKLTDNPYYGVGAGLAAAGTAAYIQGVDAVTDTVGSAVSFLGSLF